MASSKEWPLEPIVNSDLLPKGRNRILILGSRLSGAFDLSHVLQDYLKEQGIPNLDVEVLKNAGLIEDAFWGINNADGRPSIPTIPKGVILLPEMRQYYEGAGMSLNTYECGIDKEVEELCAKYGVPLVEIKNYDSPQQITEGIKQIATGQR